MSSLAHSNFRRAAQGRDRNRHEDFGRTLRGMRERLVLRRPVSERLEGELLAGHAQSLRSAVLALHLPIALAAAGLWLVLGAGAAAVWMLGASAATLLLVAIANRLLALSQRDLRVERWSALLLLGHLGVGAAFAALVPLSCSTCAPLEYEIFLFVAAIVVVGTSTIVAANLRGAILVGFTPLVAALLGRALEADDPLATAILLLPAAGVPAFALVAARLRGTSAERFRHRIEKDELILALEEERLASDEARRRAEEASLAKSRFLATMSHELRTPLNAILGFSEVVMKEILGPVGNPTYKEYVGDIHSSGRHLLDLINEILDLSRIEAGRYALNEEAVDVVSITDDCRSFLQLKAEGKSLTLSTRFEEALPLLWGDRRALRQIVLNLLSNAVKFAPARSEIVLSVGWTAGGGQYVSIRDSGPGIPEHEIPLVLSSFGQGSSAIKSAEQGTGLGLPIVQALVHLHDGEFRLEKVPSGGTEAIAIFPHSRVLEVMPALEDGI